MGMVTRATHTLVIARRRNVFKLATIPPMSITRIMRLLWLSLITLPIKTMLNMPVTLRSMIIRPIRVTTAT